MANPNQVIKLATRRELADVFGVHMMTVTKWERQDAALKKRRATA